MEKENIITVDIEDFKDSQHVLDYIDDDFAIVNSLEGTPYSNDTIKLNCFLIAVCIEGLPDSLPVSCNVLLKWKRKRGILPFISTTIR